jgi:ABC-type uncharacterized transport system substrate-binding protein
VVYGFVANLRQPGSNVTGVTQVIGALAEKQLQLLYELLPGATTVGFLVNPTNPNFAILNDVIGAAAGSLRIQVVPLSAATKDEIGAALRLDVTGV